MPESLQESAAEAARYEVPAGLLLIRWGESADLVFHPGLNSTHLIDQDAGSVLAWLQSGPASLPELASMSDLARAQALLDALRQVGLVQTALQ